MQQRLLSRLASIACVLTSIAWLSPAARCEVRIVAATGGGDFTSIQTAIDASSNGDVLLVRAGGYGAFHVDAKSLWIARHGAGTVAVAGTVEVKNLAASQRVVLSGLNVTGRYVSGEAQPALRLHDNTGHVHAVDCAFRGAEIPHPSLGEGAPGADLSNSLFAVFVRCAFTGGDSKNYCDGFVIPPCDNSGRGGAGVVTALSVPAFYDCTLQGGDGADLEYYGPGGDGGHGCHVTSFGIFASGTTFTGGRGGDADDFFPADAGDGGAGMRVEVGAQAQLLQITAVGGPGGNSFIGTDGSSGATIAGGGVVNVLPGVRRSLQADVLVPESSPVELEVHGSVGDRVYFATSMSPYFSFVAAQAGVRLLPPDTRWPRRLLGTIPLSGVLQVEIETPELTTHDVRTLFGQAIVVSAGGQTVLSAPVHFLVANCSTLNPDCNGNSSWDVCDLYQELDTDCDQNLVPDACDPDCNGNSIADACDISSKTSKDLNENGTPDECEPVNATWHVDDSAAPGGDGSITHPFRTLQEANVVSLNGHTIVVHDGFYTGADNKNLDFGTRSVSVQSVGGPASCVVDLESAGYAFRLDGNTSAETATISGLTIRNARHIAQQTGPITVIETRAVIENCVFEFNEGSAGAIWIADSPTIVRDCSFFENDGSFTTGAGAVVLRGGATTPTPPSLTRCYFVGNTGPDGGGVRITPGSYGDIRVSHSEFFQNTGTGDGGAIALGNMTSTDTSHGVIENCSIVGNSAGRGGGVGGQGRMRLTNCTIVGNFASSYGGGVSRESDASGTLESCVVWGNSATNGPQLSVRATGTVPHASLTVSYSNVQGGQAQVFVSAGQTLTWGSGNLDLDPLFVDADGADNNPNTEEDNDYRLAAGSPCIDAGDTSALPLDVLDLDLDANTLEFVPFDLGFLARRANDPAVADTGVGPAPVVDIGAHERHP